MAVSNMTKENSRVVNVDIPNVFGVEMHADCWNVRERMFV